MTLTAWLMSDRAKGFRLETGHRLFLLFINLMIIVLIYAAEFITWTGCGEQSIYGIQGRYFLPLPADSPACSKT